MVGILSTACWSPRFTRLIMTRVGAVPFTMKGPSSGPEDPELTTTLFRHWRICLIFLIVDQLSYSRSGVKDDPQVWEVGFGTYTLCDNKITWLHNISIPYYEWKTYLLCTWIRNIVHRLASTSSRTTIVQQRVKTTGSVYSSSFIDHLQGRVHYAEGSFPILALP